MATACVIIKSISLNHMSSFDHVHPSTSTKEDILVDIAYDGSVIEHYPGFEAMMREIFRAIPAISVGRTGKFSLDWRKMAQALVLP